MTGFLLPVENHVLWAWSSMGFGSALLSQDFNRLRLEESSFMEFSQLLQGEIKTAFCEGGFLLTKDYGR
ncbi:hypothetical protein [Atlantibacter sp.]|uniref:hypothetical protein n=1 Tax=Atlantibacter sp. TaxID=1903473 RepID=UPI00289CAE33|nr:hypothetical protein [Atlantibacter sp.]